MRGILLLIGASILCGGLCVEARTWPSTDGENFEGEFIVIIGDKAVIRNSNGDEVKIPLTRFSKDDLTFMELAKPPIFKIDVSKDSKQWLFPQKYKAYNPAQLPTAFDYFFTAKLKQISAGSYNHKLHVEVFVIGLERDGHNYILLDRLGSTFVPAEQEDLSYQFTGRTVRLYDYEFEEDGRRGQSYGSYLVIITDSRGEIIAYKTPKNWLYDIVEPLRALSIRAHFDKTGIRVFPPRPKMGRN
jgi:hypothetical protein